MQRWRVGCGCLNTRRLSGEGREHGGGKGGCLIRDGTEGLLAFYCEWMTDCQLLSCKFHVYIQLLPPAFVFHSLLHQRYRSIGSYAENEISGSDQTLDDLIAAMETAQILACFVPSRLLCALQLRRAGDWRAKKDKGDDKKGSNESKERQEHVHVEFLVYPSPAK